MPPPNVKLYKSPMKQEEIPFVGFPNRAVEMGTEGEVVAYIVNTSRFPYAVKHAIHDDENVTVELEKSTLYPNEAVKLTLKWKPPVTEDEDKWKPLKGGIHLHGYHVIE